MPTTIKVLTPRNQKLFDSPPVFSKSKRPAYFTYSETAREYVRKLGTSHSKASFILQYGYFKAKGRFFEPQQFHSRDINYVYRIFGFPKPKNGFAAADANRLWGGSVSTRHRQKILELECWQKCNEATKLLLTDHAIDQTKKQAPPEEILYALVDYCWQKRVVIPSYDVLSAIVSQCYLDFENTALATIDSMIGDACKDNLLKVFNTTENNTSFLAQLKRIEQSTRAQSMRNNAVLLEELSRLFFDNKKLINELNLSDQATSYFSNWTLSASTGQIKQFRKTSKIYLYLLGFVKYQFYKRQDAALEGFLKCVKESENKAKKKATEYEQNNLFKKNKAIDAVRSSEKKLLNLISEIVRVAEDPTMSDKQKVELLRNRAINVLNDGCNELDDEREFLDTYREKEKDDSILTEALESQSQSLQKKVSAIVKILVFDEEYSNKQLIKAINYYKAKGGNIGNNPPIEFLTKKEKDAIQKNNKFRTSLYKILLFLHMFKNIKGGKLSLLYSHNYRALQRYMINQEDWISNKDAYLESANLTEFRDVSECLTNLKNKLENGYHKVNKGISTGENGYLKPRPNGRYGVETPAIDHETYKYISSMLGAQGEVPVLQILREIDRDVNFTSLLTHHSNRNVVKETESNLAFAGIMGLGCNIGVRKMANRSVGITEAKLLQCTNWRFKKENLHKANARIIKGIQSIQLPNIYKIEDNCIHSASDGKKVTVAVDSLLANYSYKYYGKEKGVSVYSFIDEKQSLFHPTVISSTDREAIYVVDGLLHNSTNIHHIHSTDTHGYTEAVFATTHFINVSFAPRFKRLEDQSTYSFHTKDKYKRLGYRFLPSRNINQKVIEDNWDEILRFMATIKTGKTAASQLFKRLNSYSLDHPLYNALKEFGRIIKSLHILHFYDDLEFRQKIQKQLNRVELSNRFDNDVFWDRGRQFQVGTKEEQEKHNLCKTIIQNSIIYWNYLFLSERLGNIKNQEDKKDMLESIEKGSVITWRHVNFTGEYDFTKTNGKENQFNYRKIKALKL